MKIKLKLTPLVRLWFEGKVSRLSTANGDSSELVQETGR